MQRKSSIMLLIAAAIMLIVSCSDDPASPIRKGDEIPWPAMTDSNDVIKTIVLCYENPKDSESMSKYNALLHSQYFFGLAAGDVPPGETPIMTRAEDIASTEKIFEFETMLELAIDPEIWSWEEYPVLDEEPCENCRETQRQYFIRAQFNDETTIHQSPVGRASVSIIVSPDENDSSKWVLRAMYDLITR